MDHRIFIFVVIFLICLIEPSQPTKSKFSSKQSLVEKIDISSPIQFIPVNESKNSLVIQSKIEIQGFDCSFCEFLLFLIYGYITENSTEQDIVHIVDGICAYVPANFTQICAFLIDTYGPEIIQLILNRVPANQICTEIGICNETSIHALSDPFSKRTITSQCVICAWFQGKLATIKMDRDQLSVKRTYYRNLCNALPQRYMNECISFVSRYENEFFNWDEKQCSLKVCTV